MDYADERVFSTMFGVRLELLPTVRPLFFEERVNLFQFVFFGRIRGENFVGKSLLVLLNQLGRN